jgi:ankyrin repeat protein
MLDFLEDYTYDEIVEYITEDPSRLWELDRDGQNYLWLASVNEDNRVLQFFLDKGLSPNKRDKNGGYPISYSINHKDNFFMLLNAMDKKLLKNKDVNGMRPVDYACAYMCKYAIDALKEYTDTDDLTTKYIKAILQKDIRTIRKLKSSDPRNKRLNEVGIFTMGTIAVLTNNDELLEYMFE